MRDSWKTHLVPLKTSNPTSLFLHSHNLVNTPVKTIAMAAYQARILLMLGEEEEVVGEKGRVRSERREGWEEGIVGGVGAVQGCRRGRGEERRGGKGRVSQWCGLMSEVDSGALGVGMREREGR